MVSDDQLCTSFRNIRGNPQYFHNMLCDTFAKVRSFWAYTFFWTCSPAAFFWTEIIRGVAQQFGETADKEVNNMDNVIFLCPFSCWQCSKHW